MPFYIRSLYPDDIPQITAIIQASVRRLQTTDYTPAQREAALATVFTVDTRLIADAGYFGAETEDGRLVACGGLSARRTLYGGDHQLEPSTPDLLDPAIDAAKIRAIFVHRTSLAAASAPSSLKPPSKPPAPLASAASRWAAPSPA